MWRDSTFKIALFGHRDFCGHKALEERLFPLLRELVLKHTFTDIYIGRNGEFDVFTATIVKRLQKHLGKELVDLICVLPYTDKNIEYYEKYYDSVIIPECVEGCYPKGAITKRNRWMIDEVDLVICYVEEKSGGAYSALKYALSVGISVINLAEERGEFS